MKSVVISSMFFKKTNLSECVILIIDILNNHYIYIY